MTEDAQLKYEKQKRIEIHRKLVKLHHRLGWLSAVGLIVSLFGIINPSNTYIKCDDESIIFDKQENSISITVLLVVSLLGPYLIMFFFEWLRNHDTKKDDSALKKALLRAYHYLVSLFVGNLFSFFVVEMIKTAMSEPRPHFMKTCDPILTDEQCQQPWVHIEVSDCRNPNNLNYRNLIDAMKSFPSGHASIGVFSALFISIYMTRRARVKWSRLTIPWLQMIVWTWATLCCCSRVWDRRHHWWDVLAGAAIGAVAAWASAKYLCNNFKDKEEISMNDSSIESTVQNTEKVEDKT